MQLSRDEQFLEQRVRFGTLFDLYSTLLTEKQRRSCELLLQCDLSIAELGEELGMTRQGANDLIRRSREQLEEIEADLGLCALKHRLKSLALLVWANRSVLPPEFVQDAMELILPEGDGLDV